jgi:hypothetical protein
MGRVCGLWSAAAAVLVVVANTARATVIVEPELATMAREADAVVHAVVERTGTQMAYNASTSPWSVAEPRVLTWLSPGEGERLWIRDPGAVWVDGGRPLQGAAVHTPGEEVIVFLRRDIGRYYRTRNLAAGKLGVRRDRSAMVMQDLRELSIIGTERASGMIANGELRVLAPLHDVLGQLQFLLGARW